MTRFIHDRFAKDYLEEALSPLGIVSLNLEVSSEVAIAELTALPFDSPLRTNALELVYQLQSNLTTNQSQSLDREDRELVMAIAPVFQQKLAEAEQKGRQEGRQEGTEQGRQEAQRSMLENFWQVRFGKLDLGITDWFAPVSVLPAAEFTTLFLQLSTISADETGKPQALRLLAENVLKFYLGEFDDSLANLISILLERSPEDLSLLLPQLPQLSIEELRTWLNDGK